MTEAKIQQEILMWFTNNYGLKKHVPQYLIFSVPNETSSFMELKRKKAMGLLPGVADLVVVMKGIVLFIEVKKPTGKQSDNQIKFEKKVSALGIPYFVVRSLDDFKKIIWKYKNK